MIEISRENIYDFPIHDSEILEIRISQDDCGETDLSLDIAFCKGEFEKLSDYSNVISVEGYATFIFTCCDWINVNTLCNRTQRDSVDFVDFQHDTPELKRYSTHDASKHIIFVSQAEQE